VKVISNLYVLLGVFVLLAGIALGLWGHEVAGTFYLVVLSCAFAYLAKESREYDGEPSDEDEPDLPPSAAHATTSATTSATASTAAAEEADAASTDVEAPAAHDVAYHSSAPSLTPLLFAIGAGLILAGLVFAQWLVLVGAACTALVAVVWFVETGRRRAAEEAAKAAHGGGH
jgi:hypothetical protein